MDKYNLIINDETFSSLTLKVADYPRTLVHWENFLNFLIAKASPLNKSLEPSIYKLIKNTYESLLFHFPYLENYYVDYALFEYKLGNISKVHKIYQQGLRKCNDRSLLLWISYLKICNEVVINQRQLFHLYERAEHYIGLHFLSGEFWELYLEQIQERCLTKERYFVILRKVLEIPLHSFSRFYSRWLQCIDEIRDVSQLTRLAPKEDLLKKMKVDVNYQGRKGPYLTEAKKLMRKFTKELYMVVQYQVLEIYNLFESKLSTHYYCSPETLISSEEIATWNAYVDYTTKLKIDSLTEVNFQRALSPLAHYENIWIRYAEWLIDWKEDLVSAKNVLMNGLTMSHKKAAIIKLLCSTLCKLRDYELLELILGQKEEMYVTDIEGIDEFESFWDYLQFQIFCSNSRLQTRYEVARSDQLLPDNVLDIIITRLSCASLKKGQELLLTSLLQLQNKTNTDIIERRIFRHIIDAKWEFYLQNGLFWSLYSQLIFLDPSKSYLDRRRHIVKNIWKNATKYEGNVLPALRRFCQLYLPEDIDTLEELFEKSLDQRIFN